MEEPSKVVETVTWHPSGVARQKLGMPHCALADGRCHFCCVSFRAASGSSEREKEGRDTGTQIHTETDRGQGKL